MFRGESKWIKINYPLDSCDKTFMAARDEEIVLALEHLLYGNKKIFEYYSYDNGGITTALILINQLKNILKCETDNPRIARLLNELYPHAEFKNRVIYSMTSK